MTLQHLATILNVIAGIFFLLTGLLKIWGNNLSFWKWAKASYLKHHPVWVYYASGVIELLAGPGLLIKQFRFGSSLLLILMIVLLTVHPRKHKESLKGLWSALITISLLSFIAYMAYLS
ncbi:hypothetical protein [Mucilaginibacter gossypiicola]|nr:hypothetical protein [Mucilaginibacter gossypiicola]